MNRGSRACLGNGCERWLEWNHRLSVSARLSSLPWFLIPRLTRFNTHNDDVVLGNVTLITSKLEEISGSGHYLHLLSICVLEMASIWEMAALASVNVNNGFPSRIEPHDHGSAARIFESSAAYVRCLIPSDYLLGIPPSMFLRLWPHQRSNLTQASLRSSRTFNQPRTMRTVSVVLS